jgi:hypothetical protein
MYFSMSTIKLTLKWRFREFIGNFLYRNVVMSFASSTSIKKSLKFFKNLTNYQRLSLC